MAILKIYTKEKRRSETLWETTRIKNVQIKNSTFVRIQVVFLNNFVYFIINWEFVEKYIF